MRMIFKVLYRVQVSGTGKIPPDGRLILCANHLSYLDPVLIAAYIPRYLYYMAKKELFSNSFLGNIVTFFNAFPVNRDTADRRTIRTSIEVLADENILGIFPEGSRSSDGIIKDPKKGVGFISVLSGAPVLPVAISGTNMIVQKPRKRLFFPKVKMIIGDVINTSDIIKKYERKNAIDLISKMTMESISSLYNKLK
ncbi:MAG: 1-acyl-sn-glycerol-3-phosphate acyltransferase [Actinobacteria bacterium]|nr:1-acyl-sn-glycerol-3-phosphate acyltransferase [Actinomycetota bacterium]